MSARRCERLVHALYLTSVFLHVLAATTWIGGMLFLVLVAVPWLRRGDRALAATFLRETGTRFRNVGWICFGVLLITGSFNLYVRGVRLESFTDPGWLASPFACAVELKLALFTLVLALSGYHDFVIGPRATDALRSDPSSQRAASLRRAASVIGRANVVLALALLALGVIIVRGWP